MPASVAPTPSYKEYMQFKAKIAMFLRTWREVSGDNRRYIERGSDNLSIGPFTPAYIGMVTGLNPEQLNHLLPIARKDGLLSQAKTEGDVYEMEVYGDITFLRAQDLISMGEKLARAELASRMVYVLFALIVLAVSLLFLVDSRNTTHEAKKAAERAVAEQKCSELREQVREAHGWEYQTLGYRYWHQCAE
jgi:hypothetical protein